MTREETGNTEAREDLRLVIFDKRDLTRVMVSQRVDDLVVMNSADTVFSIIKFEGVLFVTMFAHLCFTQ